MTIRYSYSPTPPDTISEPSQETWVSSDESYVDPLIDPTVRIVEAVIRAQRPEDAPISVTGTIASIYAALKQASAGQPVVAPAVDKPTRAQIDESIKPDGLLCFEDGKTYKMLRGTLRRLGLTPAEYRAKWGLPPDYPMTCADLSAMRTEISKRAGLGKRDR